MELAERLRATKAAPTPSTREPMAAGAPEAGAEEGEASDPMTNWPDSGRIDSELAK